MVKRAENYSNRKRGHLAWMTAAAVVLYVIFAQRSLRNEQGLVRLESLPIPKTGAMEQSDISTYKVRERSFILRPDQQGVMETDKAGVSLWAHEFGSPLTAASVSAATSAWGLLNGSIQILDMEGRLLDELKPSEHAVNSAYPCIYSVAISGNGQAIAALYGLDPQYFLVFTKKNHGYELVFEKKLVNQVVSDQSVSFSGDGLSVIGRTADGLAYYDVRKKKGMVVRTDYFAGEAELLIEPIGPDRFAILLAKGNGRFAGLMREGVVEAMFPIDETGSGLSVSGDIMMIMGKDAIHRYKAAER
jgi:hypothetical protein